MKSLIALSLFLVSPTLFDITDRIVVKEQPPVTLCEMCVVPRWMNTNREVKF